MQIETVFALRVEVPTDSVNGLIPSFGKLLAGMPFAGQDL